MPSYVNYEACENWFLSLINFEKLHILVQNVSCLFKSLQTTGLDLYIEAYMNFNSLGTVSLLIKKKKEKKKKRKDVSYIQCYQNLRVLKLTFFPLWQGTSE